MRLSAAVRAAQFSSLLLPLRYYGRDFTQERNRLPQALLNNSAVALGRVAVAAPAVAAAHADAFVAGWACSLRNVTHSVEKPTAFRGFVAVLQANPEAAIPHMKFVCEAFASWASPRLRVPLPLRPAPPARVLVPSSLPGQPQASAAAGSPGGGAAREQNREDWRKPSTTAAKTG